MTSDTPKIPSESWPQASEAFRLAAESTRQRSPASFDQWFSGIQLDGIDGRVLSLAARDEFVRDWVKNHFLPDLLDALQGYLGGDSVPALEVRWRISGDLSAPVSEQKRSVLPPVRRPSEAPSSTRARIVSATRAAFMEVLNPKHTFSNFVVGPSNELAHAAALASAGGRRPSLQPALHRAAAPASARRT